VGRADVREPAVCWLVNGEWCWCCNDLFSLYQVGHLYYPVNSTVDRGSFLAYPRPYTEAEYTYLKGTGTNKTHWTVTVRCCGCTAWSGTDGTNTTISPTGTSLFAWAMASTTPKTPKDNTSTFSEHDKVNQWQHNMDYARSSLFDTWVADNLLQSTSSTTRRPSSTFSRHATMTSSTVRTTGTHPPGFLARTDESVPKRGVAKRAMPTACAGVPAPQYPVQVANGWAAVKVKGGMVSARGIVFDTAGNLLIVESGKGITAHTLANDGSGCIASSKTLIKQNNLNHGIFLNGTTLYASSMTTVWTWTYDSQMIAVGSTKTAVITGMFAGGHPTRSLIIPPTHPNLLVVSHGSNDNFDFPSGNINTGRSNIKVFDMTSVPSGGYNYVTEGHTAGYGLRNEVGFTLDPNNKFVDTLSTPESTY
jgi:Cytochrome domain of cellobiose dehydrogenase